MYISTGTMTYDAPSEREFTDNMRTAVDVCRLSRSTMSSWTSTTTNTALQNASFTLLSCSGPTKGESLDIPRPSDFAIPIVWPSGHEQKINSIHDKMGNQEPFGPQEGEREGPDGPLCRNALVSLGSFVAIFRTRLRPPFLFVCLTPFPFALLFLFSFFSG